MATLVSPGVSVTVTDDSFFIPVAAPTVPLIFIATAAEKLQADGLSPALGTFEHGVVETVTSLKQSTELYGIPNFLRDEGNLAEFHGDARNEYGLFAMNQYLGIGNRCFGIRANVNLDDDFDALQELWDEKMLDAKVVLENLINEFLNEFNATNGFIPSSPGFRVTVTGSELNSLADSATVFIFDPVQGFSSFIPVHDDYFDDQSAATFDIFASGFDQPTTGDYFGFDHVSLNIASFPSFPGGGTVAGEFTAQEGGDLLVAMADDFKFTVEFLNKTGLGANDADRRAKIVQAFLAEIVGNTEIREETFDYNLILCPGYFETVESLNALSFDIKEEALVIGDPPVDLDVDGITNPSTGWAVTVDRVSTSNVAYYYPWALATNLDGRRVTVAPSGVALRTYAFNDDVAFLWFAPAGIRRGLISGISDLGYVSGVLGGPTEFIPTHLNEGQRDSLYQDQPSGRINPLTFFPGQGFVVWGQKTSPPQASALDRVNVSRLIKYIKRQLRKNTLSFVFQPNDQLTRDNLKAVVDAFLGDLVVKRGLFDFATVSDESNNTPDRIDRSEMYIDVALKPVKAAEFIFIPIRIVSTGAEI